MAKKNILICGIPEDEYFDNIKEAISKAYIMEGRPDLFGAKILSKKLLDREIVPVIITDNSAAFCIYKKFIDEVNIFYYKNDPDKLTCRVGSLGIAVVAKYNNTPVFAYRSNHECKTDAPQDELFYFNGVKVAPDGIKAYVPLTDEVPVELVKNIY